MKKTLLLELALIAAVPVVVGAQRLSREWLEAHPGGD